MLILVLKHLHCGLYLFLAEYMASYSISFCFYLFPSLYLFSFFLYSSDLYLFLAATLSCSISSRLYLIPFVSHFSCSIYSSFLFLFLTTAMFSFSFSSCILLFLHGTAILSSSSITSSFPLLIPSFSLHSCTLLLTLLFSTTCNSHVFVSW